ncbi:MAG TPA: hypothetical protein VK835_10425 [Bacteroidia bacterium]|jgi:hypothetical protein|nr:hypothetical protein [Bacteroidia bacterium]
MEKENWINEVMQSTKGMKPVDANPFLFEKIVHKIELNRRDEVQAKSFSKGWALAASLIIVVNLISFTYMLKDKPSHQKEIGYQALSKEMGLAQTSNY